MSPDDARLGERLHLVFSLGGEEVSALKKIANPTKTLVFFEVSRTSTESSRVGFGGKSRASARFDASLRRFFSSLVRVVVFVRKKK